MVRALDKAMSQFAGSEQLQSLFDWLRLTALRQPGPDDQLKADQAIHPFASKGHAPSVLCLHGFGGVPSEVQLVADVAISLGLQTRCPRLAGHGTHPEDLAGTRFEDWVSSARQHFNELRADGPVFVAGLSMGSLVATQLALESPGGVAGLVILSGAFRLRSPFPSRLLKIVDWLETDDFYVPKGLSDIQSEEGRKAQVSYSLQPVYAALSLLKAGERLSSELHRLHKPVLQIHGAKDHVCPLEGAIETARKVTARQRSFVVLPQSGHIITRDLDQEPLRRQLEAFFRRFSTAGEA